MSRSGRKKQSEATRYRRTWPQRFLLGFNLLAIMACLATAVVVAYAHRTVGETPRTSLVSKGWEPSSEVPPGEPVNFLVVGTDNEDGLAADDPLRTGRDGGTRSDVIMIVRVDPKSEEAQVISIPRDLWVTIPTGNGRSFQAKINAAMSSGEGANESRLVDTIKENFDITINHYVEVNFASFKKVVDVIDGVKIYISHPLRDANSGLDQPVAGCVTLDSTQALAYARSRHLFWQGNDGKWHNDPTADLGRIKRQKDFVRRVIQQAISKGARNPATLRQLISKVQGNIKLDQDTTPKDLLDLANAFKSFEPADLVTDDLPVTDSTHGGQSTLELLPGADAILDRFRGTGAVGIASQVDVESVRVQVENGGAFPNAAVQATDALEAISFQVLGATDADPVTRTEVHFQAADLPEAQLVARYLDADPILVQDSSVDAIRVVLGPDYKGVLPNPVAEDELPKDTIVASTTTAVGSTTSTTAPASTTTPQTSTTVDEAGDPPVSMSYVPVSDSPEARAC